MTRRNRAFAVRTALALCSDTLGGWRRGAVRDGSRAPEPARRTAPGLLGLALVALAVAGVRGAEITGTVQLLQDGQPQRTAEVRWAVVYFEPQKAGVVRAAPQPLEITMQKKEFVPHVLAITQGSTVRFPNADPILHNVFSVSGENGFDLGLYAKGPGKSWTFTNPGLVRVYCNVHQSMAAYVLVLDTPHFVSPQSDGTFTLANVPETPGTLVVWHERAEPWKLDVQWPIAAPITAQLAITKQQVAPHLNKFGKPYRTGKVDRSY